MVIKKKNKSQIIIGSLLILIGISIFICKYCTNNKIHKIENSKIENFFNNKDSIQEKVEIKQDKKNINVYKENYIAILEIEKIHIKKGLYSINSVYNNVNKNIEIIKGSSMPDIDKGNLILAGHSGTGRIAYFKNLSKLNVGDIAIIYYNNIKYIYKITKIYDVEKTGIVNIIRNKNKSTLTMITCIENTNKQKIFISELIEKTNY